ncbi:A24 family peptidase [Microbacterium marmarense]|uniref:A24 family peptidase n=1 Tax=Microbacterium marmarense TaxID=3122051 RepID=A0ABU8LSM5_9MICO
MTPATAFLLVLLTTAGLAVGYLLNGVVARVQPRLEPSPERTRLRPTAHMHAWPRRTAVMLITPLSFVGVTWFFVSDADPSRANEVWSLAVTIVAFLYFAAVSIALTFIDLATHRLPNALVLPCYPVGAALLGCASLLVGDWQAVLTAVAGMVILFSFYFTLRSLQPRGMGGGDVKLAGVIGMYLGWLGWTALAVGAFAAFLLGGAVGVALILGGRASRTTALPFGPWMLAGAWVGIALSNSTLLVS